MISLFCEMKCKENYYLLSLHYVFCTLISPHCHNKPVVYWHYLRVDLAAKCRKPNHSGLKKYGFRSPGGGAGIDSASQWWHQGASFFSWITVLTRSIFSLLLVISWLQGDCISSRCHIHTQGRIGRVVQTQALWLHIFLTISYSYEFSHLTGEMCDQKLWRSCEKPTCYSIQPLNELYKRTESQSIYMVRFTK